MCACVSWLEANVLFSFSFFVGAGGFTGNQRAQPTTNIGGFPYFDTWVCVLFEGFFFAGFKFPHKRHTYIPLTISRFTKNTHCTIIAIQGLSLIEFFSTGGTHNAPV